MNELNAIKTNIKLTYSWRHHSLVMVGVHTDAVTFEVKGKLAVLHMFQLVLMKVRPSP